MTGFTLDPDHLRTAAQAMNQSGSDLQEQWQQLKAKSEAVRFGSTDMVSPLIQMTLMGAVQIADSCFASSQSALGGHADALSSAADHYEHAESGNAAIFSGGDS